MRRGLTLSRIRGRVVHGTLRGRRKGQGNTTQSLGVSRHALCEGVGRCRLSWGSGTAHYTATYVAINDRYICYFLWIW